MNAINQTTPETLTPRKHPHKPGGTLEAPESPINQTPNTTRNHHKTRKPNPQAPQQFPPCRQPPHYPHHHPHTHPPPTTTQTPAQHGENSAKRHERALPTLGQPHDPAPARGPTRGAVEYSPSSDYRPHLGLSPSSAVASILEHDHGGSSGFDTDIHRAAEHADRSGRGSLDTQRSTRVPRVPGRHPRTEPTERERLRRHARHRRTGGPGEPARQRTPPPRGGLIGVPVRAGGQVFVGPGSPVQSLGGTSHRLGPGSPGCGERPHPSRTSAKAPREPPFGMPRTPRTAASKLTPDESTSAFPQKADAPHPRTKRHPGGLQPRSKKSPGREHPLLSHRVKPTRSVAVGADR